VKTRSKPNKLHLVYVSENILENGFILKCESNHEGELSYQVYLLDPEFEEAAKAAILQHKTSLAADPLTNVKILEFLSRDEELNGAKP
jgi:hypothetical protein